MTANVLINRIFIALLVFSTVSFYLPTNSAQAQSSLEGLMSSRDFKKLSKTRPNSQTWKKSGSNFSKIFADNPEKLLGGWVGTLTGTRGEIRFLDHTTRQRVTHVAYQQLYKNHYTNKEVSVEIIIPKPDAVASIQAGLDPDFAKLQEPLLEVSERADYDINEIKVQLLRLVKDDSAMLKIPLARNGIALVTTNRWKDREMVIEVARGLNIDRLNKKLES